MNMNDNSVSDSEACSRRGSQKETIEKGIAHLADAVRSTCPNIIETRKNLASDFTPGPVDVILARGKKAHFHEGNKRLRQMIINNLKGYSEAPSKVEKSLIVSKIMDTVRQESNGGGFVREDDGKWYEVGDRLAREKISQSFRDLLHTKYRSSTKARTKLKAKAKEITECNNSKQFGLNEYVQSGLMQLPIESNAIQSHDIFAGIRPSDWKNSTISLSSSSFRDSNYKNCRSNTKARGMLMEKEKENTDCNDIQPYGLNECFQSGLMELGIEKNEIQSRGGFAGTILSELEDSKSTSLLHAKQHAESDRGGLQKKEISIEQASNINGYNIARSATPTMFGPVFEPSVSDISPLVSCTKLSPLSNRFICTFDADFLGITTGGNQTTGARSESSMELLRLDEAMGRPFSPIQDLDWDIQTMD